RHSAAAYGVFMIHGDRIRPEGVARMYAGPLNEWQRIVVGWRCIDQRRAAPGLGVRQVTEFLGVATGEKGVVVDFESFHHRQRSMSPVRKVAPVLVCSLMSVRLEVHRHTPAMIGF